MQSLLCSFLEWYLIRNYKQLSAAKQRATLMRKLIWLTLTQPTIYSKYFFFLVTWQRWRVLLTLISAIYSWWKRPVSMGNQHKHEILSVAVKVAAFDESGIRRDFFNSLLLPNQPHLAASPLAVHSYWAKWHRKPPKFKSKYMKNWLGIIIAHEFEVHPFTGNGNSLLRKFVKSHKPCLAQALKERKKCQSLAPSFLMKIQRKKIPELSLAGVLGVL